MPESSVVLVTGASSGFGLATASHLAARGFRVFGTSRRPGGRKEEGFELLELNVDSDQSVNSCISALIERAGRIDVLVNGAGYALTGGLEETSIAEAKAHFETNFFGVVRMVNAVLPNMRQNRSGRIVNLGSAAGTIPVPFEGFYAATKAALLAYTETLRHEVKSFNIKVSILEPGFFRTNLGTARKEAARSISDYEGMRARASAQLLEDFETGEDPRIVAETLSKIIEDPSPRLRYSVGRGKRYLLMRKIVPASTFESSVRKHYRLDG